MLLKQTKIVASISDRRCDVDFIKQLFEAGMNVVRMNTAHASREGFEALIANVRTVSNRIAILMDTKGPEVRTTANEEPIPYKIGEKVKIVGNPELETTRECIAVSYPNFVHDLNIGGTILIDDGDLELEVIDKTADYLLCEVKNEATLGSRKSVNVPGVRINLPSLTEKDRNNILYAIEKDIDFIAHSFVRNRQDVLDIRAILDAHNSDIKIIAKIENAEGIQNIDEIIRCADGIMIARGDLGVEIPAEEVPYLQKMLIQKCNDNFKPVITATQMLDSMIRNPRPTRAEVTDVANAVYDGTDAVMLSGETAQGKYPVEALQMMVHIIQNTEQHLDYEGMLEKTGGHLKSGVSSAIGYSSVLAASNLNAKCIITPSVSGATARVVSNLRPRQVILGVTPNERTLRRMSIYWGVKPIKSQAFNTTDDICDGAIELAKVKQFVETGEIVVITAGIPSPNVKKERSATSNMMRIATVE